MPPPKCAKRKRCNSYPFALNTLRRGVGFGRRSFFVTLPASYSVQPMVVLPSKYLMASWSAVEVPSPRGPQAPALPVPGLFFCVGWDGECRMAIRI